MIRFIILSLASLATLCSIGCSVFGFIGAGKQAMEDQMLIEKPAEYNLEGKSVAVVIDTDLAVHYEHPGISTSIAGGVAARIAKNTPDVKIVRPDLVARWQFETPQWSAMPSTDIAKSLQVDCVIFIDLQNYSLTPPGNQWLWEGRCSATVGIIEAESYEHDGFSDSYEIMVEFPHRPSVLSREEASKETIQQGLILEFVKNTAWLFYFHEEPKHPDRYRPELNQ
ncbi:MAG: hypothetical protein ISR75_02910 [Phycisphaerales bacterium]|nr:hypothetical protein [Planctomycetota bacterium]MBL6997373.1 hypothetical protein [Phycisphaerales bacterium]